MCISDWSSDVALPISRQRGAPQDPGERGQAMRQLHGQRLVQHLQHELDRLVHLQDLGAVVVPGLLERLPGSRDVAVADAVSPVTDEALLVELLALFLPQAPLVVATDPLLRSEVESRRGPTLGTGRERGV